MKKIKKKSKDKAGSHHLPANGRQGQALRVLKKNLHPLGSIFISKTLTAPPPVLKKGFLFSFLFSGLGRFFLFSFLC
jgi:hypothetical protein